MQLNFRGTVSTESALSTSLCEGLPVITDPVYDDPDGLIGGIPTKQLEACVPTRSQRISKATRLLFKVSWELITTGILVYIIQDASSLASLSMPP